MPIKEVYQMTWAEFLLRSFSFWEERERELMLHAKMDYKLYCLNFSYSKKKPDSFKAFAKKEYGLDVKSATKLGANERKKAFEEAIKQWQKEKNG